MSLATFEISYLDNCHFNNKNWHSFKKFLMCTVRLYQTVTLVIDGSRDIALRMLAYAFVEDVAPVTIMQL